MRFKNFLETNRKQWDAAHNVLDGMERAFGHTAQQIFDMDPVKLGELLKYQIPTKSWPLRRFVAMVKRAAKQKMEG